MADTFIATFRAEFTAEDDVEAQIVANDIIEAAMKKLLAEDG